MLVCAGLSTINYYFDSLDIMRKIPNMSIDIEILDIELSSLEREGAIPTTVLCALSPGISHR